MCMLKGVIKPIFKFVTFAFLAIIRLKHSANPFHPMEQCQHMVSVDSMEVYKSTMGHSIMLVGIIVGIVFTFTLYTLVILSLGFVVESVPMPTDLVVELIK